MPAFNEKRDYNRFSTHCEITYRLFDQESTRQGYCTSVSGAGLSFLTTETIAEGKALEIKVSPNHKSNTPSLIAFIETVRSSQQADGRFEIAAAIKGIKADS